VITALGIAQILAWGTSFYFPAVFAGPIVALVGLSHAWPIYLLAWVLIGFGMGTGLYDAVFAALGRMYGSEARGPITSLTLFGGFAGTVCWPLSAFMIEHLGWRSACFIYAAIHLLVMLPLQASVVRAPAKAGSGTDKQAPSSETPRII